MRAHSVTKPTVAAALALTALFTAGPTRATPPAQPPPGQPGYPPPPPPPAQPPPPGPADGSYPPPPVELNLPETGDDLPTTEEDS
ncbi:MAG: hypothetical protein LBE08_00010 [Bifidobacteriaceae bacterium]|nr:hypothetical protein [Bifidobacteriaceae bacterium]